MADEKNGRLQGSVNHAVDLNKSLNSATSLLQTVNQSQNVNTGGGSGATGNANSSSTTSDSGTSSKK